MLQDVEPFCSFLKAFKLFGFDFNGITFRHKFLSAFAAFAASVYYFLSILSLLQAESIDEFTERLLFIPSMLGLILKAINLLLNTRKVIKFMRSFDEAFKDEVLPEKALKNAYSLAKLQFYLMTSISVVFVFYSLATNKLTVPMFIISIDGWESEILLFNLILEIFGCFYSSYLWVIVDLVPISLMMILSEYIRNLNESFANLRTGDNQFMKRDFIKLVKLHQTQKR